MKISRLIEYVDKNGDIQTRGIVECTGLDTAILNTELTIMNVKKDSDKYKEEKMNLRLDERTKLIIDKQCKENKQCDECSLCKEKEQKRL